MSKKQVAPIKTISRQDKAMVQLYASNPKMTKTEAWKRTHNSKTENQSSIYQQAAHTFKEPQVKSELAKYSGMIEDAIITTVDDWKREESPRKREIAMDAAKFVHDKIHGKAVQQIQTSSTSVNVTIDLSAEPDTTSSAPIDI